MRNTYYIPALFAICNVIAESAIVQGPVIDAITHSTARVTWVTDVPSTTIIRYGVTSSYGMTMTGLSGVTAHSWYISGLAPFKTYHFQVCSAASGLAETCSSDKVFTTLVRPSRYPEPVRQAVNISMPTGAWESPISIDSGCSNLRSVMASLAALTGSLNYEIRIPPRTECRGQFVFPKRPNHTGWVVIRSSAPDSAFPQGVRVSATSTDQMVLFRTDVLPALRYHLNYLPSTCSPDALFSSHSTPGMGIFVCQSQGGSGTAKSIVSVTNTGNGVVLKVPGHGYRTGNVVHVAQSGAGIDGGWRIRLVDADQFVIEGALTAGLYTGSGTATRNESWTQVAHQTGTTLPGTCAVNSWFYKTDKPTEEAAYWCTANNVWTNVRVSFTPSNESYGAIQFQEGAERYRFIGIEVTHNPVPNPPPPGWAQKNYGQGSVGSLVATGETNKDIIFDRCDIHGLDYPARLSFAVFLNGRNVAIVNSRVHKVNRWTEKADGGNMESIAINSIGPGPGRIENNFLEAIGITVFFPDDGGYHLTPAADYQIRRNYFSHPVKYLVGSPANISGKNYMNRHHLELKRGRRMLIEGNIFDTNWMDFNQAAFIALSPRPGALPSPKTITNVSYGTVTTSSTLYPYQSDMLVSVNGTGAANHDGIHQVASVPVGNIFTMASPPAGTGTTGTTVAVASDIQISDIRIRSNIFRYGPNVLWVLGHHDGAGGVLNTKTTQRIAFRNNLVYGIDARSAAAGGWTSPLTTYAPWGRPGIIAYTARGVEDFTMRNNTIVDVKGFAPTFLFSELPQYGSGAGLLVQNNIFTATPPQAIQINGQYVGTDALNMAWTAYPGTSWDFNRNVFCCNVPAAVQALQAPGNSWAVSEAAIGFVNPGLNNFQLLPTSPYAAGKICFSVAGDCTTNGKAAGVDFFLLQLVLGKDERLP